jgi:glutamyl-tRNA synthetase
VTARPVVRFAPSPTGRIHIGNARTATLNWLYALKHEGRFILRFDDTDVQRSKHEYEVAIAEDLGWLGIEPHLTVRQSERIQLYTEAAARLKASGRLYPAWETPEELDRKRKRQQMRHLPPVYDRAALALTDAQKRTYESEGRRPHWRFLLDRRRVAWEDLIRGHQEIDTGSLSDPVMIREDGSWLYTFTSVVDDIDLDITTVIRGEDHVANTAVQIELFEALGAATPAFAHHSLLVGADGQGLSKRLGSLSIGGLRGAGYEPMAVASIAGLIGTPEAVHPCLDYAELLKSFDLSHVSRAPARFAESELAQVNAKLLHIMPYAQAKPHLVALDADAGEAFWLAVRGNLGVMQDARDWLAVVSGSITPVIENADLLQQARDLLPAEPWDAATWKTWTEALKAKSGLKGKALFHPLRLALTGRETGPELAALLPLIGRARVLERLAA